MSDEQTALVPANGGSAAILPRGITSEDLRVVGEQFNLLHKFVKEHLREGVDYGTIPGAGTKKVLLKPGAERILLLYRCTPSFDIQEKELDSGGRDGQDGHFEVRVKCRAMRLSDGACLAEGDGSANTRERKFLRKDGTPYDVRNNVLKMAKKRASVDCALNLSGLSDAFTQDIEEERGTIDPPSQTQPVDPPSNAPVEDLEIRFGKDKGKRLSELSEEKLLWYQTFFSDSANDPTKAKYSDSNRKYALACEAEIARRMPL